MGDVVICGQSGRDGLHVPGPDELDFGSRMLQSTLIDWSSD
jgi:hypothetical protein